MKKILMFAIIALLVTTGAMALVSNDNNGVCGNNGFNCECKEFYNGNSNYYTIAKWEFDGNAFNLVEQNKLYGYFNTNVVGNLNAVDWTSNLNLNSVLVKTDNETLAFDGRSEGAITITKNINHITFCGYKHGGSSGSRGASVCVGSSCSTNINNNSNGVPEFSTLTIGAAVLVVTLGLVFLRKR